MEEKDNKMDSLYTQFANKVEKLNSVDGAKEMDIWWTVVIEIFLLAWVGFTGYVKDMYPIAILFAVVTGIEMVWLYCERYMKVEGDGNRPSQFICEVCANTPFSLEFYYHEIGRRLRKKTLILCGVVFVALLLLNITKFEKYFMWILGLCMLRIGLMLVVVIVSNKIYQLVTNKRYNEIMNGKKQIRRKAHKPDSDFWSSHSTLHLVVIVISVLIAFGLVTYRDYLLRVPQNIEVYRTIVDGFWFEYPLYMCFIFVGEQFSRFVMRDNPNRKKLMGAFLVAGVILFCGTTCHTTYYTDRIVAQRFIQTTEYSWKDVESYTYTIKCDLIDSQVKLELRMKDNRKLSVITDDNIASEVHNYKYWIDFQYAAHVIEKLDAQGVQGEFVIGSEKEKIEPDELEAFEALEEKINGK